MAGSGVIEALAEPREGGGWTIRSPHVGILRGVARPGGRQMGGALIGRLTILNRTRDLILPVASDGILVDLKIHDRAAPVEYGQELFSLVPATGSAAESALQSAGAADATMPGAGELLPGGCQAVVAPIDGIFYRRLSPGAPPCVEEGATIETGQQLGLIEAMKSFNAVLYGGPGLPARAVIVQARADDGAEVRQGAVLFVVRAS